MKTLQNVIDYKEFKEISYVFNTRPELIETITELYDLKKLSADIQYHKFIQFN